MIGQGNLTRRTAKVIAGGLAACVFMLSSCATKSEVARTETQDQEVLAAASAPKPVYAATGGDLAVTQKTRGVCIYSNSPLAFQRPEADLTIQNFSDVNANAVALVVSWYQPKTDSDVISPPDGKWEAKQDEALGHAIDRAHQNGLAVMLKPHVEVQDGTFRGNIGGSAAWFESYSSFILRFAELAQKHKVELLCIGTELENLTYNGWQAEWEQLIAEIRKVYSGKLTYAANWTEYETVCFWDKMDVIGIDSYFPLTEKADPTQQELDQGWQKIAEKLGAWRAQHKIEKPILFTEVGYQSADQTNVTPWSTPSRKEDQDEQAMALQALFKAVAARDWFGGLYYWRYTPAEVYRPLDHSIKGKKAEEVLKQWYGKRTEG